MDVQYGVLYGVSLHTDPVQTVKISMVPLRMEPNCHYTLYLYEVTLPPYNLQNHNNLGALGPDPSGRAIKDP